MKILIFSGSNHLSGYTRQIAHSLMDAFSEYEPTLVDCAKTQVGACLGCEYCRDHQGCCVIQDAMQPIYEEMMEADLIIMVAPVYFNAFPSGIKAIIDRCQMFYNLKDKRAIRPKRFAAIHIGGANPYPTQFEGIKGVYKYWLPNFRATLTDFIEISSTDRTPPLEDEEVLQQMKEFIERMKKGELNESFKRS